MSLFHRGMDATRIATDVAGAEEIHDFLAGGFTGS